MFETSVIYFKNKKSLWLLSGGWSAVGENGGGSPGKGPPRLRGEETGLD